MRQRGSILVYLAMAMVAMAMMYGLFALVDRNWVTTAGIKKGEAAKQAEWDAANRKAEADAKVARLEREKEARKASAELQDAESRAREWQAKWRKDRTNGNRLAVCPEGPATPRTALAGASPPPDRLRLTYGFLHDYDGVWTGLAGEPLFGDPRGSAEGAPSPDAPSAVGLEELLDVHAENAARASAASRQLTKLIRLIRRLQQQPAAAPPQ